MYSSYVTDQSISGEIAVFKLYLPDSGLNVPHAFCCQSFVSQVARFVMHTNIITCSSNTVDPTSWNEYSKRGLRLNMMHRKSFGTDLWRLDWVSVSVERFGGSGHRYVRKEATIHCVCSSTLQLTSYRHNVLLTFTSICQLPAGFSHSERKQSSMWMWFQRPDKA